MERQDAWFRQLEAAFTTAAANAPGPDEAHYSIASVPVWIRFAGPVSAALVRPAFEHLREPAPAPTQDASPPLCVGVFDGPSAGCNMPGPPGTLQRFTARGDILGFDTPRFRVAFQPFGRILSAIDFERNQAFYCVGDPAGLMDFERAAPLRSILGWWLPQRGRQPIHAAAVGTESGGILLAGKSGSGKSNTALACLQAGMAYAADDFCAIDTECEPRAFSLFATGRTAARDWDRLPFLRATALPSGKLESEKAVYLLHPQFATRLRRSLLLRAIFLPKVNPGLPFGCERASFSEAILALAPVTTALLPGAGSELFQSIQQLVRQLPCFRLNLGNDIQRVTNFLQDWLAQSLRGASR